MEAEHSQPAQSEEQRRRESGQPGKGRIEDVRGSGVYPASGPLPPGDAPYQGLACWGQGDRGAEGYADHGDSELIMAREFDASAKDLAGPEPNSQLHDQTIENLVTDEQSPSEGRQPG